MLPPFVIAKDALFLLSTPPLSLTSFSTVVLTAYPLPR
jgi:hypothetical protein